jgi:hypothetical protein
VGEAVAVRPGALEYVRPGALEYVRDLGPTEGMFAVVEGYGQDPVHHAVTVRTPDAALAITGDAPVHRLHVFATGRTVCPEVFVDLDLAPGATGTWTSRYALEP